jgi:hypothetical protein
MNDEAKLIEAGTVTKKIAESLAPLPDTPPLLVAIHKKIPQAEPNHYRIEDLTDDDVRLLRDIWAGLSIPAAWNMTQEQFARCKTVFEAAPNKPTWQIQAEFRDYQNEAKGEQRKIATEHMRHIEAEVKNGCFEILTSYRIPTDKLEPGTLMRIADASSYLQPLGLDTLWLSDIDKPATKVEAVKPGITKGSVINSFEGMYFDRDKWNKYLGDPPNWLMECRVAKGNKKTSATWNPVLIAAALFDKEIAITRLDAVLVRLPDWANEWREASASFRG